MWIRQRAPQYCIDDTEERRVGADPNCQRGIAASAKDWLFSNIRIP